MLEIVGGVLLLFLSPTQIEHIVRTVTAHELAQDPHDFIARHLLHTASRLTTATTPFGAVYLLSHGVSKLVLVVLVLQGGLWAYPWLVALLLGFIGYQLYRLTVHASIGLIALTIFDALLVWLTWGEYRAKGATPNIGEHGPACPTYARHDDFADEPDRAVEPSALRQPGS